jgi:hypothetical protein
MFSDYGSYHASMFSQKQKYLFQTSESHYHANTSSTTSNLFLKILRFNHHHKFEIVYVIVKKVIIEMLFFLSIFTVPKNVIILPPQAYET